MRAGSRQDAVVRQAVDGGALTAHLSYDKETVEPDFAWSPFVIPGPSANVEPDPAELVGVDVAAVRAILCGHHQSEQ